MTEQPARPDSPAPSDDAAPDRPAGDAAAPLGDVPPVAGGTDTSPPAQGEGESDSW